MVLFSFSYVFALVLCFEKFFPPVCFYVLTLYLIKSLNKLWSKHTQKKRTCQAPFLRVVFVEFCRKFFLHIFHIIPCIFSLSVLEWFYRICIHLYAPRTYPLCKTMPAVFAMTQNIGGSPAAVIQKGFSMQEKYDTNTTPAVDMKPDPDFLPFTNDFIFSLSCATRRFAGSCWRSHCPKRISARSKL